MANPDLNSALGIAAAPASQGIAGAQERATNRYLDAYRVARSIVALGKAIKVLGILGGVIILIAGFVLAANTGGDASTVAFLSCLFTAVCVGFFAFIAGVMVSAQGQQLLAVLDSAIHTSPFLDPDAKARAMGL
jgi:hypothetical protein